MHDEFYTDTRNACPYLHDELIYFSFAILFCNVT